MRLLIPSIGILAVAAGHHSSAWAQAHANAAAQASDAFGFRSGDDSVGIYDESSVRGFNLEAAGNYRVNGSYFVKNSGVSSFFLESTSVRIGYSTLNSILPGPSGVVDYRLREPAAREPSSFTAGLDAFEQPYVELHFKHRDTADRGAYSLGLARVFDVRDQQGGAGGKSVLIAGAGRLNVADGTVRVFGGEYQYERPGQFRVLTDGTALPPKVERGRFLGQRWAMEKGQRRIAGTLIDWRLSDRSGLGATAVFSQEDPSRAFTQIFRDLRPDGTARSLIVATPHQRSTSWSGELRGHLERNFGMLANRVDATVRLRRSRSRFGGSEIVDLGRTAFGEAAEQVPPVELGDAAAQLQDAVDQWGIGLTYRAALRDRVQLNLGVLKTDYRKLFTAPGGATQESRATPWLYNIGGSWRVNKRVELYGSYSRGLEEAGVAPATATNRNQLLTAIEVTQRELGTRLLLPRSLTMVVALFDTRKPYAGIDTSSGAYGFLGSVRHRGIESSLTGKPVRGLSLVVGGVFIDADISSSGDKAERVGRRPVGVPRWRGLASVDYQLPMIAGLSVDAAVSILGDRAASSTLPEPGGEQLKVEGFANLNLGLRYRFAAVGRDFVVRAQLLNALDRHAWEVNSSEALNYNPQRRVRLVLTSML